jgi:hypothetical protein
MSIERLIISNLRRAQALDTSLRTAAGIESIAASFVGRIMFNPNAAQRAEAIDAIRLALNTHAVNEVLPQADRIGRQNALDIIRKTPSPENPLPPAQQRGSVIQAKIRMQERQVQVKLSIQENTAKLQGRLTRYYSQPAEGTPTEKVNRLKDVHARMEEKRKAFESKMREFNSSKTGTRPAKPNLDFMSKMTDDVKTDIKVQARRAATDAETALFRERGHNKLGWIVPNGHSACPDCQLRAAVVLTLEEWERYGRPGSGFTICDDSCFCMLVPVETFRTAPGLKFTFSRVKPVRTTPQQLAVFNANRVA